MNEFPWPTAPRESDATEEQLKEYVLSQQAPDTFNVRPYYSKVGDFISFCWVPNERFFTRRVDEFLTTYHSMRTKEVVGCKVKGICYLIGRLRKAEHIYDECKR